MDKIIKTAKQRLKLLRSDEYKAKEIAAYPLFYLTKAYLLHIIYLTREPNAGARPAAGNLVVKK